MTSENITPEFLQNWLTENGKKASWLATTLHITPGSVSRWLTGKHPIANSDQALLKLLIWGEMPFEIVGEKLLTRVLEFTEDQWKVISILAKRQGTTPRAWIAEKLQTILAYDAKAQAVAADLSRKKQFPPLEAHPEAKIPAKKRASGKQP